MLSPLVVDFLISSALPGAVVAILIFVLGAQKDPLRARLQALVLALGFGVGNYIMLKRLQFPPHDMPEGYTWAALLLAAFVWVIPKPSGSRYLVRIPFVLAVAWLTLGPIQSSLHGYVMMRNLLAFFCLGVGVWSILERAALSVRVPSLIALPLMSATALSLILLFKGSASLAQMVGLLCTLLGAVLLVSLVATKKVSAGAILPFVSIFIVSLMATGHFYLEFNPWLMIYICVPFLVLWIRDWIPFVPKIPIPEMIILAILSGIPLSYIVWNVYKSSGPLY